MKKAISGDEIGTRLTVRIPLMIRKRGGRRVVVTPEDSGLGRSTAHVQDAAVSALARSFRWKKLLESGRYASIEEMADAERINSSYLGRVLRLSLLAPVIVENLLDGRGPHLPLAKILKPFPTDWAEQERWVE
jgi:hypothetical protein